jgi:hypothetical protein
MSENNQTPSHETNTNNFFSNEPGVIGTIILISLGLLFCSCWFMQSYLANKPTFQILVYSFTFFLIGYLTLNISPYVFKNYSEKKQLATLCFLLVLFY